MATTGGLSLLMVGLPTMTKRQGIQRPRPPLRTVIRYKGQLILWCYAYNAGIRHNDGNWRVQVYGNKTSIYSEDCPHFRTLADARAHAKMVSTLGW